MKRFDHGCELTDQGQSQNERIPEEELQVAQLSHYGRWAEIQMLEQGQGEELEG